MRPIFTVHAGEYLVGSHIEEKLKGLNVWIPAKDTGIDLLITDSKNENTISLQVKFSKDFPKKDYLKEDIAARGWWTLRRDKIKESRADFWVFVLYSFAKNDENYIIIEPNELLKRLTILHGQNKNIQSYFWVTKANKCWETRGLRKREQLAIAKEAYENADRDFTKYLNNWEPLTNKLL